MNLLHRRARCSRLVVGGGEGQTPNLCLFAGQQIAECPKECPFYIHGKPTSADRLTMPALVKRMRNLRLLSIFLVIIVGLAISAMAIIFTELGLLILTIP